MNLKKIFFFICSLITLNCFSQNNNEADIVDITKVTFFAPGVSYEKRVGEFQSVYGHIFTSTFLSFDHSSSLGNTSFFSLDPAVNLQYRYYYNSEKRAIKGKTTEMNNLNYIGPVFEAVFSKKSISTSYVVENNRRAIYTLGFLWGMQRNYNSRFSLDLNLGLGYLFTKGTLENSTQAKNIGQFTSIGQLHLGFWLNKRN